MKVNALGQSSADASETHELAPLVASWRRSLSARGRSPKTVTIYTSEADAFGRSLARLISNVGGSGAARAESGRDFAYVVVIVTLSRETPAACPKGPIPGPRRPGDRGTAGGDLSHHLFRLRAEWLLRALG